MSIRDFMYGFLQGFNQAGGTQKLSSWTARNIAGGQYYDPMSDPYFMQQLAQAKSMDIPAAYQRFADTWGQYIDLPEGQTLDQYLFNKEPEPQNIYGIPAENFRNLMLETASRGQDIPVDVLKEYEKTTGINISPVLQMVSPEKQGNTFEDIIRLYANVRNVESPVLQDIFMQEYSDLLPAGVTPEDLFPEQRPGVLDLLRADLRNLAPEDVERYRDAGYHVTEVYPGWYAVQEGLPAERGYSPIDLMIKGFIPLTEEQVTEFEGSGYIPVEVPDYSGYYSLVKGPATTQTGYDYSKLDMPTILSMMMLDNTISPEERKLWEKSPWATFGEPETLWSALTPPVEEIETGYDYSKLDPDELLGWIMQDNTVSPAERKLWEKSPWATFGEPETLWRARTQQKTTGFDFGELKFNDFIGTTPDGRPVYESPRGGRVALNMNGTAENWVGEVILPQSPVPETNRLGTLDDGRGIYKNNAGLVVLKNWQPYIDEYGNMYSYYIDMFNEPKIRTFKPEWSTPEEIPVEEPGLFEKIGQSISGLFGKEEGEQDRVNELTQEYIERYPNNTPEDIARFLASLSKEDKKEFKEIYGVDINKVISELNRRKKDEQ